MSQASEIARLQGADVKALRARVDAIEPDALATPVLGYLGAYDPLAAYAPGYLVTFGGRSYLSAAPSTGVEPGTDAATWLLFSSGNGLSVADPIEDQTLTEGGGQPTFDLDAAFGIVPAPPYHAAVNPSGVATAVVQGSTLTLGGVAVGDTSASVYAVVGQDIVGFTFAITVEPAAATAPVVQLVPTSRGYSTGEDVSVDLVSTGGQVDALAWFVDGVAAEPAVAGDTYTLAAAELGGVGLKTVRVEATGPAGQDVAEVVVGYGALYLDAMPPAELAEVRAATGMVLLTRDYDGPLVRLRREWDGDEQDFGVNQSLALDVDAVEDWAQDAPAGDRVTRVVQVYQQTRAEWDPLDFPPVAQGSGPNRPRMTDEDGRVSFLLDAAGDPAVPGYQFDGTVDPASAEYTGLVRYLDVPLAQPMSAGAFSLFLVGQPAELERAETDADGNSADDPVPPPSYAVSVAKANAFAQHNVALDYRLSSGPSVLIGAQAAKRNTIDAPASLIGASAIHVRHDATAGLGSGAGHTDTGELASVRVNLSERGAVALGYTDPTEGAFAYQNDLDLLRLGANTKGEDNPYCGLLSTVIVVGVGVADATTEAGYLASRAFTGVGPANADPAALLDQSTDASVVLRSWIASNAAADLAHVWQRPTADYTGLTRAEKAQALYHLGMVRAHASPSLSAAALYHEGWYTLDDGQGRGMEATGEVRLPGHDPNGGKLQSYRIGDEMAEAYAWGRTGAGPGEFAVALPGIASAQAGARAVGLRALHLLAVDLIQMVPHLNTAYWGKAEALGKILRPAAFVYLCCRHLMTAEARAAYATLMRLGFQTCAGRVPVDVNTNKGSEVVEAACYAYVAAEQDGAAYGAVDRTLQTAAVAAAAEFLNTRGDQADPSADRVLMSAGYITEGEAYEPSYGRRASYHVTKGAGMLRTAVAVQGTSDAGAPLLYRAEWSFLRDASDSLESQQWAHFHKVGGERYASPVLAERYRSGRAPAGRTSGGWESGQLWHEDRDVLAAMMYDGARPSPKLREIPSTEAEIEAEIDATLALLEGYEDPVTDAAPGQVHRMAFYWSDERSVPMAGADVVAVLDRAAAQADPADELPLYRDEAPSGVIEQGEPGRPEFAHVWGTAANARRWTASLEMMERQPRYASIMGGNVIAFGTDAQINLASVHGKAGGEYGVESGSAYKADSSRLGTITNIPVPSLSAQAFFDVVSAPAGALVAGDVVTLAGDLLTENKVVPGRRYSFVGPEKALDPDPPSRVYRLHATVASAVLAGGNTEVTVGEVVVKGDGAGVLSAGDALMWSFTTAYRRQTAMSKGVDAEGRTYYETVTEPADVRGRLFAGDEGVTGELAGDLRLRVRMTIMEDGVEQRWTAECDAAAQGEWRPPLVVTLPTFLRLGTDDAASAARVEGWDGSAWPSLEPGQTATASHVRIGRDYSSLDPDVAGRVYDYVHLGGSYPVDAVDYHTPYQLDEHHRNVRAEVAPAGTWQATETAALRWSVTDPGLVASEVSAAWQNTEGATYAEGYDLPLAAEVTFPGSPSATLVEYRTVANGTPSAWEAAALSDGKWRALLTAPSGLERAELRATADPGTAEEVVYPVVSRAMTSAPTAVAYADSFTAADETAIEGRVPDVAGASPYAVLAQSAPAEWKVGSNAAVSVDGLREAAVIDLGTTRGVVQGTVTRGGIPLGSHGGVAAAWAQNRIFSVAHDGASARLHNANGADVTVAAVGGAFDNAAPATHTLMQVDGFTVARVEQGAVSAVAVLWEPPPGAEQATQWGFAAQGAGVVVDDVEVRTW